MTILTTKTRRQRGDCTKKLRQEKGVTESGRAGAKRLGSTSKHIESGGMSAQNSQQRGSECVSNS